MHYPIFISGYANDQPKAQKKANIDLYLLSLNILFVNWFIVIPLRWRDAFYDKAIDYS